MVTLCQQYVIVHKPYKYVVPQCYFSPPPYPSPPLPHPEMTHCLKLLMTTRNPPTLFPPSDPHPLHSQECNNFAFSSFTFRREHLAYFTQLKSRYMLPMSQQTLGAGVLNLGLQEANEAPHRSPQRIACPGRCGANPPN